MSIKIMLPICILKYRDPWLLQQFSQMLYKESILPLLHMGLWLSLVFLSSVKFAVDFLFCQVSALIGDSSNRCLIIFPSEGG